MATVIYLTNTPATDVSLSTGGSFLLAGIGTRGPAASASSISVANTSNPGSASTNSMTLTPSGTVAYWVTRPLSAAVTIAGTVTCNFWGGVSAGAQDIDFQCFKLSGGSVSSVTVFVTTINATLSATKVLHPVAQILPTSTAFAAGDRIAILGNVNTTGVPAGGSTTLGYNGFTENVDGDTWFQFAEDITTTVAQGPAFLRGPSSQHLETLRYYTAAVSSISTAQMVSGDAKLEAFLNELGAQRDLQGS